MLLPLMPNLIAGASLCLSPWGGFTEQVPSLREDCKLPRILQRQHLHDEKNPKKKGIKTSRVLPHSSSIAQPIHKGLLWTLWFGLGSSERGWTKFGPDFDQLVFSSAETQTQKLAPSGWTEPSHRGRYWFRIGVLQANRQSAVLSGRLCRS